MPDFKHGESIVSIDHYRDGSDGQRGHIYRVCIKGTEGAATYVRGYFNVEYWGMGQCGLVVLSSMDQCRVVDDYLYKAIFYDYLFQCLTDNYALSAQAFIFNSYAKADQREVGLAPWLVKQENCRPVHTWKNRAHSPFNQMCLFMWHKNPVGVPKEWGIDLSNVQF